MGFARKSALAALYSLFTITLFSFGLLFSIKMVLGTPQPLEQALSQSGMYDVITQQIINDNKGSSSLPLDQAGVQSAVQKAFPPELLQKSTNQVLDGTYAWLQGKTTSPDFRVDLSGAKQNMANYVGDYVRQRLDSLPACTIATLPANLNNINPYTVSCLPPQANKTAIVQQAKEQALANTDILDTSVLTANNLKNDDGKTLAEQLQAIPRLYHDLIVGIYLTGAMALLTGIGILLLHTQRRAGARRLAVTMVSVGGLSGLAAWLAAYVLKRAAESLGHNNQTAQLIQTKLVQVIQLLANDLRHWWLGYGIALVVLGVAVWVALKFLTPKPAAHAPAGPTPNDNTFIRPN